MAYYVVKFLSEPYMLQDNKIVDKQVIMAGELIVKSEYLSIMKANTNWYWQQIRTEESVIIVTHTIVHPCLDMSNIKDVADTPISLCDKEPARKAIQRHTTCMSDAYHDCILDEINHQDQIECKRK